MADLYSQLSTASRRVKPNSMFIPQLTPIILDTDGSTLPSGETVWASNDSDADNYSLSSDFQAQNGDIFLAVQAIQQYCEVYEIGGASDSNLMTVIVRDSSIPYDTDTTFQSEGTVVTKLQTAVRAALDGADVIVKIGRITDDDTDG
jgi:hypothetical protein